MVKRMAKFDDCPKRIYITLDDVARDVLAFQCKNLGMSKSNYICQLIKSTVDREYVLSFKKK